MSQRSSKKDHLLTQLEILQQNIDELITIAKSSTFIQNIQNSTAEVFDLTEELFFELNIFGNILNINKAAINLLGYKNEELSGLNFVDFIPVSEKKKYRELLSKLKLDAPPVSFYVHLINKTGENTNILCKALKKGEFIYIMGFPTEESILTLIGKTIQAQDGSKPAITEYLPLNEDEITPSIPATTNPFDHAAFPPSSTNDPTIGTPLKNRPETGIFSNAENHLKAVINSSKQILFLIDNQMDIIAFNKHAEAVVMEHSGKKLKAGHNILHFLEEDDAAGLKEIYREVLNGRSVHFTRAVCLPNKSKRWFEVNLFPVPVGDELAHVHNTVFCVEDISERKLAEERFKEMEINFKSVFTQVAVGVFLSNLNNEIIRANKRFYDLIEYSQEEFKDIQLIDITHPEDRDKSIKLSKKLLNGHCEHYSLEKRYITKSGRIVWVYLTVTAVKTQQGKPKHMISVAQDITLRKTAEQELLYKKSELDTFVYRASHDLRGPVASLMGLYNIVKVEFAHDKNAITYFEHYNNSVMRLHTVLQNLIDLTKIKESETELTEVDIKELIDSCMDTMKSLPDYNRISFDIAVDINFKVYIDSKKFKTIIKNLVENSIIYATPESTAFVKVQVTYQENVLKIEVSDNGRGIEPRIQSKVFNMFFRGTEKSKGSGLGLYIVKNAVEKLNGSIQLSSKLNEGTKFSVYIPYLYGQEYADFLEKNYVS